MERELNTLDAQGVISKVKYSDWVVAPLVVVPKKDRKPRLCGDYKVTVHPMLVINRYPLPKPEDLFASLTAWWAHFSES